MLVIVRGFTAAVVMCLVLHGMRLHVRMTKHGRDRFGKALKGQYRKRYCQNQLRQPARKHTYQSKPKTLNGVTLPLSKQSVSLIPVPQYGVKRGLS